MNLRNLPSRIWQKAVRLTTGDGHAFLKQCKSIVHIGANSGQERDLYLKLNLKVLWVEALPDAFARLAANIEGYSGQQAVNALLTDVDGEAYNFKVASNEGASSSIFDFKDHTKLWPDISFVNEIVLRSKKLSTLLKEHETPFTRFDALILDVQGAELLVLQGADEYLKCFRFIQCEASDFEAYAGACNATELIRFMASHFFRLTRKECFASKDGVGGYYEMLFHRET